MLTEEMTQEDEQLLLVDLCARLPYGVKLLVEGWDSDRDCKFDTVETLIGIDDRFIYTIWDKTGDKDKHSIVEPLSILDYKPYLRPMSSMTEEEKKEYNNLCDFAQSYHYEFGDIVDDIELYDNFASIDYLNKKMFDFRGLIPAGYAIEVTEDNNPYKD